MDVSFLLADAESLPFSDSTFDVVVSSLSTCTFSDPVIALQEMGRVCGPKGQVLLLEHGRSDREWAWPLGRTATPMNSRARSAAIGTGNLWTSSGEQA
jgi:ubiquinone/menaquinone biosynthesis C-methylase UbiE